MEIKLLTSEELIRTAKGFLHTQCGYIDNLDLSGGKAVSFIPRKKLEAKCQLKSYSIMNLQPNYNN